MLAWPVAALTLAGLFLSAAPSFATGGCAITNCYVCATVGFSNRQFCTPADSADGRLCCTAYGSGDCRTFDDYCYGIIVRDV